MAPNNKPNGELLDHRLTALESKVDKIHDEIHQAEKGILDRLEETEDVVAEVKALKAWAQRLGITGIGAIALFYIDQIKAALKIGGSP
jgi:hypothetical protein